MTLSRKRFLHGIGLLVVVMTLIIGYREWRRLDAVGKQFKKDIQKAEVLAAQAMKYADQGQYIEAAESYRQAHSLLRTNWRVDLVTNNLAWLLATCPDDSVRNGSEAIALMEQMKPHDWVELDTLAAAYAETGRFNEAVDTIKQALTLVDADARTRLEQRLELYLAGKPYREELIPASQQP